jgi:hypothetical protein
VKSGEGLLDRRCAHPPVAQQTGVLWGKLNVTGATSLFGRCAGIMYYLIILRMHERFILLGPDGTRID